MSVKKAKTRPVNKGSLRQPQKVESDKPKTIKEEFQAIASEEQRKKALEILTPIGFNAKYDDLFKDHSLSKAEDVYELTEQAHMKESGGKRKYSNFDSFRQIRKRIIRGEMK